MQIWLAEKSYFHEVIIWMYNCQLQAMAFQRGDSAATLQFQSIQR